MIESRSLDDLLPIVRDRAIHAIADAEMRTGLKIIVVCTYRDDEKQRAYYAQGRSLPGRIVTNDPGPGAAHSLRVAIDIAPAIKNPDTGRLGLYYETSDWGIIADAFKQQGFEWGGDWKNYKDRPHFQWTQFQTLAEIRNGATVCDPNETMETGNG